MYSRDFIWLNPSNSLMKLALWSMQIIQLQIREVKWTVHSHIPNKAHTSCLWLQNPWPRPLGNTAPLFIAGISTIVPESYVHRWESGNSPPGISQHSLPFDLHLSSLAWGSLCCFTFSPLEVSYVFAQKFQRPILLLFLGLMPSVDSLTSPSTCFFDLHSNRFFVGHLTCLIIWLFPSSSLYWVGMKRPSVVLLFMSMIRKHVKINHIKGKVIVYFLLVKGIWTVRESLFPVVNDMDILFRSRSRNQWCGALVCFGPMTLAEWGASKRIFWLSQNIFPVAIWRLYKFSQRVWQVISLDRRARTWCSPKYCQFGHQMHRVSAKADVLFSRPVQQGGSPAKPA